jgi:SAM-dependent methyltransferase
MGHPKQLLSEIFTTVDSEFPWEFVETLRCPRDAGSLSIAANFRNTSLGILDGRLHCNICGVEYPIQNGVVLLLEDPHTPESSHEIIIRDVEYGITDTPAVETSAYTWRSEVSDHVEIPPFLAELTPLDECRVLEFGCGDGRLTILMAQLGARVLAVDFSLNALRKIGTQLPQGIAPTSYQRTGKNRVQDLRGRVGLVQADASRFRVTPRSFARALASTPLDSRDERMAMYGTIAEALTDEGRFIGSVEHDDLLRRMLGLPIARRYERGGIFIEHFDAQAMRREVAPYFRSIRIRPIRPKVPFVPRLPVKWAVRILSAVGATPGARQLGEILLMRAELPVRPPKEGANRGGNKILKALFYWYMKRIGKEPMWGDERV